MTDRAGFCDGCGMPVCCDQLRAVIDAAREFEKHLPGDTGYGPATRRLRAAVHALDGGDR